MCTSSMKWNGTFTNELQTNTIHIEIGFLVEHGQINILSNGKRQSIFY